VNAALPVAVAVGDPCGVGPSISVEAALQRREHAPLVLFGVGQQLEALLRARGATTRCVALADGELPPLGHAEIGVVDCGAIDPNLIARHAACGEAGEQQLRALRGAAEAVRARRARALVTGPTSKLAVVRAGHAFSGQTEFLARLDGRADDDVTMMFLGPKLRVALVTTHLAVAEVPAAITGLRVQRSVRHLAQALLQLLPALPHAVPSIAVAGLNPHAGEAGLFGREEIEVLAPSLAALRAEEPFSSGRAALHGPAPAEAVLRAAQRGQFDGVVAMFHDQATIASKLLDWGAAVNTTWGLSFLRTSVDHGVAYDAAARGAAEPEGMLAALDLALELTRNKHE
jgi:4-hydroxythreonine-4-phosphate dehydrogenase